MKVFITGTSSGLGKALAEGFVNTGCTVYGLSRTKINVPGVHSIQCNLSDLWGISRALEPVQKESFDYIILNAGMLGRLAPTRDLSLEEYEQVFNVNFLSNKVILDHLFLRGVPKNVIGISSGAALKPYFGWSLYCTTKAAFKQLLATYAEENKDTHFLSLAPGIVKTKMQDFICQHDESKIPSVAKFKSMYDEMDSPEVVAGKILANLDLLKGKPSGSYFDMREL